MHLSLWKPLNHNPHCKISCSTVNGLCRFLLKLNRWIYLCLCFHSWFYDSNDFICIPRELSNMTLNKLDKILTPVQIINQTTLRTEAEQSEWFSQKYLFHGADGTFKNFCLSYQVVALDTFNRDSVSTQCLLRKNRTSISSPRVKGLFACVAKPQRVIAITIVIFNCFCHWVNQYF